MNHRQSEPEVTPEKEASSLEILLKNFWERAHTATDIITQLRSERRALQDRVGTMEKEVARLQAESYAKEQELKRLRAEHQQLLNSNGQEVLSPEERENLKNRIRELIAKISSHL